MRMNHSTVRHSHVVKDGDPSVKCAVFAHVMSPLFLLGNTEGEGELTCFSATAITVNNKPI